MTSTKRTTSLQGQNDQSVLYSEVPLTPAQCLPIHSFTSCLRSTTDPPSPEQPTSVTVSDSEEEIDFGFWEKAPAVLTGSNGSTGGVGSRADLIPSSETDKHRTDSVHELDLGLL